MSAHPAGWYPDPYDDTVDDAAAATADDIGASIRRERWWDGSSWTPHEREVPVGDDARN